MKILIAEDLEDNREMLKTLLTGSGYNVKACKNGKEALALLHDEEFDLIISDILMPVMDGYRLCLECKKDKNITHIPFVFYSATYVSEEDEKLAYSIGVEKFIRKPKEPEEFLKILVKVISDNKLLGPKSSKPQVESEDEVMKLYSQRLINKLEKKMLDLEKSQELFKSVFDSANDAIVIVDSEGKILDINNAGLTLFGYSCNEIIGQHLSVLAPENLHIEQQELIKKVKETKSIKNFVTHRKGKGKRIFPVEMSMAIMNNRVGDELGFISIIRDITERKRSEEEITRLYKAISQTPTPIALTDLNGFFTYVNPKICELSGYSKEELIGNHSRILKSGKHAPEFYKNLWDTITSGKTWKGEFINKKKNGDLYLIDASISPVFNGNGKIIHYIKVSKDITAQRKMENDLRQSKEKAEESDRLKTAFLNNMSHEIRTPLNGITGFIGLLQDSEIDDEEKQHYFEFINKSSDRLIATVTDIMDISRIEAGEVNVSKTEVSVNKILEEQYNFFYHEAKSKGLELIYKPSLSDREARFVTDKLKLEGILTNLIKNAIKFTEKGEITFACSLKKEQNIEVIEFYVKDTGIGIPADRIEAVFNRFEQADIEDTRAHEGSGLGLAIAKSYVEMLGGTISVSSKEGSGSTFTFTIPYNKRIIEESTSNQNKEGAPSISLNNLSVIVAEDDETSKMFFETVFKNTFKNISFTTSGTETVDKLRENPETDLILMDIKMPDMNGYDATREIRKFNQDVVIIAQTAFGLTGDREKAIEAGCNDYISKPINKDKLQALIQKYFGG